jgi:hypothetical protein
MRREHAQPPLGTAPYSDDLAGPSFKRSPYRDLVRFLQSELAE